jgi:hypothetical protein
MAAKNLSICFHTVTKLLREAFIIIRFQRREAALGHIDEPVPVVIERYRAQAETVRRTGVDRTGPPDRCRR